MHFQFGLQVIDGENSERYNCCCCIEGLKKGGIKGQIQEKLQHFVTLEATMRDLFPTGQTTNSQSVSNSDGTSTSHSDSMS